MGYTLCVIGSQDICLTSQSLYISDETTGCGTMGIAIISGVLASLDSNSSGPIPKWEAHTSGTATPVALVDEDPALPTRFLACVSREVSARGLKSTFTEVSRLGAAVEVFVSDNIRAVKQSDVVLLWSASLKFSPNRMKNDSIPSVANHSLPMRF